eukprot:TRINITY_DN1225_c0_g1_i1.p2 TRINITY_DN1225_c0_g1~~TRINITY_DN1225_c0_g1_i1.p2  ORF type:complete len:165 (-),score=46.95 TRINITY_DN1225_c0_g1_i1:79-573(-)
MVNWSPANATLLLRGASREPGKEGAMTKGPLHGLFDDIADVLEKHTEVPEPQDLPPFSPPSELRRKFRQVMLQSRRVARRLGLAPSEPFFGNEDSDSSSSSSEIAKPAAKRPRNRFHDASSDNIWHCGGAGNAGDAAGGAGGVGGAGGAFGDACRAGGAGCASC